MAEPHKELEQFVSNLLKFTIRAFLIMIVFALVYVLVNCWAIASDVSQYGKKK